MLEVRYNTVTRKLTAWCGDPGQFGNLDRGRDNEAIRVLDIPIPTKSIETLLYDETTQTLIDNLDYIDPILKPSRLDKLEARIKQLERR